MCLGVMFHVLLRNSLAITLNKFMGIPEGNAVRDAEIIPIATKRIDGRRRAGFRAFIDDRECHMPDEKDKDQDAWLIERATAQNNWAQAKSDYATSVTLHDAGIYYAAVDRKSVV